MKATTDTAHAHMSAKEQINLEICLLEYCYGGDLEAVRRLLEGSITGDVLKKSTHLEKALQLACENGQLPIVRYLIEKAPIPTFSLDKPNFLPFLMSCEKGHLDIVSYFLTSLRTKNKISIHKPTDKALSIAAEAGQVEIMRYLLTSPDLPRHACFNSHILTQACLSLDPDMKSLHYLLFEYKVDARLGFMDDFLNNHNFPLKEKALELVRAQKEKFSFETAFSDSDLAELESQSSAALEPPTRGSVSRISKI